MRKLSAWFIKKVLVYLYIPWKRKVSAQELHEFRNEDYAAYALLTFTPWCLSNWGIKGKYKHMEIIVGPDTMCSARRDGFLARAVHYVLERSSKYAILRLRNVTEEQRHAIANLAIKYSKENIRYDFELSLKSTDSWYCTEAATAIVKEIIPSIKFEYGKMIHPEEIYEDKVNWEIVKEVEV